MKERTLWTETPEGLYARFVLADFSEAWAFMNRVALAAEKSDHHPGWKNVWNTVDIWLNTHSAGGAVTEKDRRLAAAIDKIWDTIQ